MGLRMCTRLRTTCVSAKQYCSSCAVCARASMLLRSGGMGARGRERKFSRTGTGHIGSNNIFFAHGNRETHMHARRATGVGVREQTSIGLSMRTRLSMTSVSAKHYCHTCAVYAAASMLLRARGVRAHGRERKFSRTRTAHIACNSNFFAHGNKINEQINEQERACRDTMRRSFCDTPRAHGVPDASRAVLAAP